ARLPNPSILDISLASVQLADAVVGQSLAVIVNASGGLQPYAWRVAPGSAMPPGLSLVPASSTGAPVSQSFNPGATAIVGVAAAAGQYTFDLIVTDSIGTQTRRTCTLKVATITLPSAAPRAATANAAYAQQFT